MDPEQKIGKSVTPSSSETRLLAYISILDATIASTPDVKEIVKAASIMNFQEILNVESNLQEKLTSFKKMLDLRIELAEIDYKNVKSDTELNKLCIGKNTEDLLAITKEVSVISLKTVQTSEKIDKFVKKLQTRQTGFEDSFTSQTSKFQVIDNEMETLNRKLNLRLDQIEELVIGELTEVKEVKEDFEKV